MINKIYLADVKLEKLVWIDCVCRPTGTCVLTSFIPSPKGLGYFRVVPPGQKATRFNSTSKERDVSRIEREH